MASWNKLIISGLISREGKPFDIAVGAPKEVEGAYQCQVEIPTIADHQIYGENALSTLISALRVVQVQVYEPSATLIAATTLTEDDYPELEITFCGMNTE